LWRNFPAAMQQPCKIKVFVGPDHVLGNRLGVAS
jgi:hypothetical protein